MTHAGDPRELATLATVTGRQANPAWAELLGDLAIDEAALVRATGTEGAPVKQFKSLRA